MATQPTQFPPIQVFEVNNVLLLPVTNVIVTEFPLNPDFPHKYIYVYCFLGASGPGAGFLALDFQFRVNDGFLFSLPFVFNNTTNGVNRFGGGSPSPQDPLWPNSVASLFSFSLIGAVGTSENQILFTPNSLITGEPNQTLLSPFELDIEADKLRVQSLGYSYASPTIRFWMAIIQLRKNAN